MSHGYQYHYHIVSYFFQDGDLHAQGLLVFLLHLCLFNALNSPGGAVRAALALFHSRKGATAEQQNIGRDCTQSHTNMVVQ